MRWKCFLVKSIRQGDWQPLPSGGRIRRLYYTLPDGREVEFEALPVGAMYDCNQLPTELVVGGILGSKPQGVRKTRTGLCVVLPGKTIWNMMQPGTRDNCVWTIKGEPPNVSAHPSIDCTGIYHGWVKDGFVSDDLNGRKFGDDGYLIRN